MASSAVSRILAPTAKIEIPTMTALFYGQPGAGKSTLGNTSAKPLVLDFDRGAHRVLNRQHIYPVTAWSDVEQLLREPEAMAPFETLVLDTVGRALDVLGNKIIQGDAKLGSLASGLNLRGYGALKSQFAAFIANIRQLGKHVVMLAHEKEERDGDAKSVRPDIQGASLGEVLKLADVVGYVCVRNNQRVIDCNPTDAYYGKNPCAWSALPFPRPETKPLFLAELLESARQHFGEVADQSAGVNATVAAFRDAAQACETAEDLTSMLDGLAEVAEGPAKLQCRSILNERAKALGAVYDRKAKAFAIPSPDSEPDVEAS